LFALTILLKIKIIIYTLQDTDTGPDINISAIFHCNIVMEK